MTLIEQRQTKPQLCVIGNSKLSQMLHSLIPEFQAIASISIVDNIFTDAVNAARELIEQQQVDAILSAGANAFYLQDTLPVPVVGLQVTTVDLIQAVWTASHISKHILLISYERQETDLDILKIFEGVQIIHRTYGTAEEIKGIFHEYRGDGAEVVVGSSYACDLADRWHMNSVMIYSRESCRRLLHEAIRVVKEHRNTIRQQALVQHVLDQVSHPMIFADQQGDILASNAAANQLPGLGARRRLRGVLERHLLEAPPFQAEQLQLEGRGFVLDKEPVEVHGERVGYVYHFRRDRLAESRTDQRQMIYRSKRMHEVAQLLSAYGETRGAVLLCGETGTGKELAARSIHASSSRVGGPFVAVNCSAIPEDLFESELFGYAEGAFTGARRGGRSGLLESANSGTFFLDEINSLPLMQQAKLLRVLEDGEITPVGARRAIALDVRFVAAANADLESEIRAGRFREDLYYRLSTFVVRMPPLRERVEDIPLLAASMTRRACERYEVAGFDVHQLISGLQDTFQRYAWPGNVRQLENVIERLVASFRIYRSSAALLDALDRIVPELFESNRDQPSATGQLQLMESEEIDRALKRFGGNRERTAEYLGISQTTLWRRLKRDRAK